MSRHFDVVIAGGGPAGAAAALTLAKLGRTVLLANAASRRRVRAGESFAAAAKPLLVDLGVISAFERAQHLACYGNVSVWGRDEPYATTSLHELQGCSYQLDRDAFDGMLLAAAKAAGATLSEQSQVALTHVDTARPREVELTTPLGRRQLSCAWLLDATGRSAMLSRRLGVRRTRLDGLVAFQTRLRSSACTDSDASSIVEATRSGWWYSTLLRCGERLACFFTDADMTNDTGLSSAAGFMAALEGTNVIADLVKQHGYSCSEAPRGTDASTAWLEVAAGPGWLAIGEAAVSFDPLSARGVASALHAGMQAGHAVHATLGGDTGAIGRHLLHQRAVTCNYLHQLRNVYSWERRWPRSEFWRRRHHFQFEGDIQ